MTTVTSATSTATTTSSSSTSSASVISSDFNTFLQMLTVQLQNQDPMNPIESSDYAVQLATFSGVEQAVQTNDLLETLVTQMGVMGMSELAGWVGMEARASAPAYFNGTDPVTIAPNPVEAADQTVLVISDASGNEVVRRLITSGSEQLDWDGYSDSGLLQEAGLYSFSLENYENGELIETQTVETYNRITEAQGTSSGTVLLLEGGATIGTADVTALRGG